MDLHIESWVTIGKVISIITQCAFLIYGMANDLKSNGRLTRAGKIAVVGAAVSGLTTLALFLGENAIKDRSNAEAELARRKTDEQQRLTRLRSKQLQYPFSTARMDLLIGFNPNSIMAQRLCKKEWQLLESYGDTSGSSYSKIIDDWVLTKLSAALFTVVIADNSLSENDVRMMGRPEDHALSLFVAHERLSWDAMKETFNTLSHVSCGKKKTASIYFNFNALEIKKRSPVLTSLLELKDKKIFVRAGGNFGAEGEIRYVRLHFSPNGLDETMSAEFGTQLDEYGSSPSPSLRAFREEHPSGLSLLFGIATINSQSMPNLPLAD